MLNMTVMTSTQQKMTRRLFAAFKWNTRTGRPASPLETEHVSGEAMHTEPWPLGESGNCTLARITPMVGDGWLADDSYAPLRSRLNLSVKIYMVWDTWQDAYCPR